MVENAFWQGELDLFLASGVVHSGLHPFDLAQIDSGGFSQETARINPGGLRPFRNADGFSLKVFRRRNAVVGAHVECRMAEHARGKYRNADEGRIAQRGKANEFAEG